MPALQRQDAPLHQVELLMAKISFGALPLGACFAAREGTPRATYKKIAPNRSIHIASNKITGPMRPGTKFYAKSCSAGLSGGRKKKKKRKPPQGGARKWAMWERRMTRMYGQ
jgi:hypothetical protein